MLPTYESWTNHYAVPKSRKLLISDGLGKLTLGLALIGAMSRAQGVEPVLDAVDADQLPGLTEAIAANHLSEDQLFEESIRGYLSSF